MVLGKIEKIALGVGLLAVAGAGVYVTTRLSGLRDQRKREKADKDEVDRLAKMGIVPSHSEAQMRSFADALAGNFAKLGVTDWFDRGKDRAESILKEMNNTADVRLLIDVYGERKLESGPLGYLVGDNIPKGLETHVTEELFEEQKKRINALYKERGINHRWV